MTCHIFPARTALHIASEDWDSLMHAVLTRLQLTVDAPRAVSADLAADGIPPRVRDTVLECVEALQQLRTSRMDESVLRQQLELADFDPSTALAQTRVQLAGTQAEAHGAKHLALHDPLTALPNRRLFRTRLDHALALAQSQWRPIAVLYLDLDDFKPINDVHGHDTGDQLLQIVALRLRRALRPEDTVSRVGGDEFACLLADVPSRQQLRQLVCKLFDTVSGPLKIGQARLTVRPSIGVAEGPFAGVTSELLLKQADEAMYHAKNQRTGYAFFDQRAAA